MNPKCLLIEKIAATESEDAFAPRGQRRSVERDRRGCRVELDDLRLMVTVTMLRLLSDLKDARHVPFVAAKMT